MTLKEFRKKIRAEARFVDKKPYSHNIISILLHQIDEEYGTVAANKVIRDLHLDRLGWQEMPEE